jgi:AcrR family transcriptional regulator
MVQQRSEETRARILAAAEDCFARIGYDATGVAEICAAAGVSKGAFYHHFPTKQAVFMSLLNRWLERLNTSLESIQGQGLPPAETLTTMSGLVDNVFLDAAGRLPIFFEFWTRALHDPSVGPELVTPFQKYRDFFTRIVQSGIEDGSMHFESPETAARVIIAFAIGLILQGLLMPADADWPAVARGGMQLLIQGLSGPSSP